MFQVIKDLELESELKMKLDRYLTTNELFNGRIKKVITEVVNIFKVIDNLSDTKKLELTLDLVYGGLDNVLNTNTYTRFSKIDYNGETVNPDVYIKQLARKMYFAVLPLYQSKEFFNANYNWTKLTDLINGEASIETTNTGKITNKANVDSKTLQYLMGKVHAKELAPEYLDNGTTDKTTNDATTNTDIKGTTKTKSTRPKMEYLNRVITLISQQQFLFEDAYRDFINDVVFPIQSLPTNLFTYWWRFN